MRLHFAVELSMGQMMVWNDETQIEIELGITQASSFRMIASIIEKDPSTISKEIKKTSNR